MKVIDGGKNDDGSIVTPCGFVPQALGHGPCIRHKGHDGPCAHPLAHDFAVALAEKAEADDKGVVLEDDKGEVCGMRSLPEQPVCGPCMLSKGHLGWHVSGDGGQRWSNPRRLREDELLELESRMEGSQCDAHRPWSVNYASVGEHIYSINDAVGEMVVGAANRYASLSGDPADLELIVDAVNHLPHLVAEVRAQRKLIAELKALFVRRGPGGLDG